MALAAQTSPRATAPAWQRWIRDNLFSNVQNTILTLVTLVLVILVVRGVLGWALTTARWDVVLPNWTNFMVGRYPREELWRIWLGLAIIMASSGFSWGTSSRKAPVPLAPFITLTVIALGFVITQNGFPSGLFVPGICAVMMAGFFVGRSVPASSRTVGILWAAVLVVFVFLLGTDFGRGAVESDLWGGLVLTMLLSVVSIIASFPLGVLLAVGRTSNLPIISALCTVFIEVVRGVPLVAVLFIAQLFVPLLTGGWNADKVVRAIIGITVFSAAYLAENVRGGLQSLPRGQVEAARALGLTGTQTLLQIVLPQALKAVLPALAGQAIALFKDTSLVSIIGLKDLLGVGDSIKANPDWIGRQMEIYLVIAVIYAVFSYWFSGRVRNLEKQLNTSR